MGNSHDVLTADPADDLATLAECERLFAEVLADIVGTEHVSVDSHFFDDLGADSMLMARFCARVRKRPDLPSVSMPDIYKHPTTRSLAAALANDVLTADPADDLATLAECERLFAEVLADIVGTEHVSVDSHFFDDLGADSMLMARFCARVRKRADLPPVSMPDIYKHPTTRSLVAALANDVLTTDPADDLTTLAECERRFAEVLTEIVGTEHVSVDSHFFDDLGADSMLMARFCARVRKRPDLPSVSMPDIYQHPTIRSLAAALATDVLTAGPADNLTAPTECERRFAEVLADIAGTEQVSVDSHFFDDLGADSMVMARFCARVRKRPDLPSVSMQDIYKHPTIRSLAAALTNTRDRHHTHACPAASNSGGSPRSAEARLAMVGTSSAGRCSSCSSSATPPLPRSSR